jgi:hypothetical protein
VTLHARTSAGKWHLGQRPQYSPLNNGFSSYYGVPYSNDMGTSAWEGRTPLPPFQPTPLPLMANFSIIEQPVNLGNITLRYKNAAIGT